MSFFLLPQAPPIIATGQGKPAPALVHTYVLERGLLEAVFVNLETLILSKIISSPQTAKNSFMLK
jgi:hypothetical protein